MTRQSYDDLLLVGNMICLAKYHGVFDNYSRSEKGRWASWRDSLSPPVNVR